MDRKLSEFVTLLRRQGLRISPPEVADAAAAVARLGYAHRQRFHDALGATLAKSLADRLIFEHCFAEFFTFAPAAAEPPAPAPARPLPGQEFLFGQGEGSGGGGSQGRGPGVPGVAPSVLGEQLLERGTDELQLALAQALAQGNLAAMRVLTQQGLFGRRVLMAMGLADLERELAELGRQDHPAAARRRARLQLALGELRREVRERVARYFQLARSRDRDAIVRDTDFRLLEDSAATRAVIRRLARKLITRHRHREKQAARGRLDVRATLRRNLAHDGVLMAPAWRRIRRDRPQLVVVCDVSRSVSQHARFLLLFLYSLQEVIPRLRSFVFASALHEVTALFEQQPVDAALATVMDRYGLGSTDYGRAFADLAAQGAVLDRRSTLVILGDARNNHGDPRLDLLRQFHARARQLIWLNPEERNRWGSGDSEMTRYASACSQVFSCRTLDELERIIDRLLRVA